MVQLSQIVSSYGSKQGEILIRLQETYSTILASLTQL